MLWKPWPTDDFPSYKPTLISGIQFAMLNNQIRQPDWMEKWEHPMERGPQDVTRNVEVTGSPQTNSGLVNCYPDEVIGSPKWGGQECFTMLQKCFILVRRFQSEYSKNNNRWKAQSMATKTCISIVFPIIFPQPSAGEGEICIDPSHLPGVGVHHAGLLPCYRRLVEQLTQDTAEVAEIVFLSGV